MKNKSSLMVLVLLAVTGTLTLFSTHSFAQSSLINRALGKPVAVKSTESASFPGSNAVDGNVLTKWSSSSSGFAQTLNVDLEAGYRVNMVVIKWIDTYFSGTYDIQTSNDRINWSTVSTIANATPRTVDSIKNLNGLGRYVQFNGRGRSGGNAGSRYRIAEFEVYGEEPAPVTPEQQVGIDTITSRLLRPFITGAVDEVYITSISNSLLADGSWASIDYTSVTADFPAGSHLNRLKAMAVAYRSPGNSFYESAALKDKIMLGLDYYLMVKPQSTNWWYNDIGGPQDYMIPVLLLKGKISDTTLYRYSAYLRDQTVRFAGGGKNLSWIASITMYKGCIEDSYRLLDISFKAIYSSLVIVPVQGDEGIKIDNSFHQHHAQLYSGGYGMSIMSDFASTIELAEGTDFISSISADNRQVLSNVLLKGHQLLGYRNVIDFGSMGRNISRETTSSYTNMSKDVLDKMSSLDATKSADYDAWKLNLNGGVFPAAYRGNNHFWKSDIMTQHGANYYLSAKVISKRTYGTESLNDENIKGYNLPLGATNILTDGGEYQKIYPTWDWTRIPGTTAERNQDSTALNTYLIGTNDFGGGVSNGNSGVIAFEGDYRKVKAKKAYFFMNDEMLCLGAGINANQANPIVTSVNQAFLSGDVTYSNGGAPQTFSGTSQTSANLQWVHQRNVGYIFPAGGNMTLEQGQQSGSWRSINIDGSTATVNNNVFSLWFDHGNHPVDETYQYIVVPDKSLTDFESSYASHGFIVVRNDTNMQAVRNDVQHQYAIVFYNAGTADMGDGLTVTSDKEAIVLISKTADGYTVSVSDPMYAASTASIVLNKNLTGANATFAGANTTISVALPSGDYLGSTITNAYTLSAEAPLPVSLLSYTARAEGSSARLDWSTAQEQGNKGFEIYRSADGDRFERIGTVGGAGNTNLTKLYSYNDKSPVNGINYYRLMQRDMDGKVKDHGVRTVVFGDNNNTRIYPNPARDQALVNFKAGTYNSAILSDINGKVYKTFTIAAGSDRLSIPVAGYLPGSYYIRLEGKSGSKIIKLNKL